MKFLERIKEKINQFFDKIFGVDRLYLFEVEREDGTTDYYYVCKRKKKAKMSQKEAWKIFKEIMKQNEEDGKKYPKPVKIKPKFVKAFVD